MAELVLSPIIDSTISRVISTAMEQINLAVRWKLELKKLCSKLTMIRAVLQDAEHRGLVSSPPVKIWLGKLRDVAREAEDVLDEVTYERLKREVEFENQMKKKVCFFFTLSNPLVFRLQMNNKIQNLITSIVEINDEATKFGLQSRLAGPVLESRSKPTTTYSCLGYCSEVIGRKGDLSKIVDLLIDSSNKQPLSVISIWGMGGLGKTTVVKSVLKDEKISKHFGQIMFVCVSEDFDVRRILKEIFESLNQMSCSIENVSTLVETIRRKLKNENYLLILDDVWNEDRLKWEALRGCLLEINKNKGSRIVVTTRSEKVALTMGTVDEHVYHLKGLNHQECWSIMRQRAFGDSSVPNPELEGIGRQIAKKCGGVPLVANVMGATLGNRKDRHEWLLIKNLDAWDSLKDDSGEGIQRILQLSYDRLPSSTLKQCFAFCSILPKGYPIQKEVLIQLWMAEGYLQPPEGSSVVIEDIGDRYFNDLLSYSLFEGEERDLYGNIYRMHDLIHDLAMYNSKSEALIFKASSERNIAHVQHLNLVDSRERMPTNFGEVAEKLHSLFCEADTFNKMSQSFKRLRILKLWDADKLHQLPVSIGKMKHLRFLDISGANIKEVPQFIMKLYSLQTFRFMNCHLIEKQPKGVENLVNLKHIYFNNEKCMPVGIGRLTDLQTLGLFVVGRQEGSQITELGGLSRLKGELWISHLEHVENYPESSKAKLCEKIGVYKLKLEWKWGRNIVESKIDETVLEGLRPHSSLRSLIVKGYGGEKCPSWMNCSLSEFFFLNNLVELNIEFCNKLKCIPNMSGFSALQQFNIIRCKELTSIGDEAFVLPTSLRQLLLSDCPRLEAIGDSLCALTCLEDLELIRCENLRPIPSVNGLSSLRKLSIVDCDGLVCLPSGLSSCIALKVLWISNCCNLITISEDLKELRSLVVLRIFDCKNLRSIPKESLPSNIGLDWVEKTNTYNASSSTAQYPMSSDN